jgi:hypothetical protein
MGQHKLQLSEDIRTEERNKFDEIRDITASLPLIYLEPGRSNIGRNKAKRARKEQK